MTRQFTGWHMFAIFVAFFGTIAAVNFTMARYASGTFGGVVVENSYVASQEFNSWLAAAEASEALGWDVDTVWQEDGRLELRVTGAPDMLAASGTARHPVGQLPDQTLSFIRMAPGQYLSQEALPAGRWTLRLELQGGADTWRREETLR